MTAFGRNQQSDFRRRCWPHSVYFELRKPNPDGAKVSAMMSRYFYVVAFQGAMQVAIIIVMARFATGL